MTHLERDSRCLRGERIEPKALAGELQFLWNAWRKQHPMFSSPFLSIDFAQAVGAVRPDARIAVFHDERGVAGFLGFQQGVGRTAVPLAAGYNDVHGVLKRADAAFSYRQVLEVLGKESFRFHAMVDAGLDLTPFTFKNRPTFMADLQVADQGYVDYLEQSSKTIFKQRKKTRKMIKDLGPLRLELACRDPRVLERVIELKRAQYQRTHIFDLLSLDWVQQLWRRLHAQHELACHGVLSVLYAGDQLVAAHFGLREQSCLHYWFPVYDLAFHQYSPGTALFLEICRQADKVGIKTIDFGYGEQPYKRKLTNESSTLAYGRIDRSRARWWSDRCQYWLRRQGARIPWKEAIKPWVRQLLPNLDSEPFR
jgi:CelD/BcsL family acetyltransferase involved in cellulose biosynthesis